MRFYKFALIKKYFDIGIGVTSYFTKVLMVVGISAIAEGMSLKTTIILALIYTAFCFLLGYVWLKSGLFKAEQEVNNIYNLFVEQMRKEIIKEKNI